VNNFPDRKMLEVAFQRQRISEATPSVTIITLGGDTLEGDTVHGITLEARNFE
jgi:acetoin utilization deacetylase AcuC-like enzyme